jgi:glucose-1-phosphate thymidylyltransferase
VSGDILIISTPDDLPRFKRLFGDGSHLGLRFNYAVQQKPRGIAEALIIGEEFINNDNVWLILGDNIFFGHGLPELFEKGFRT